MRKRTLQGFTLVELIVVIAILGVLVGILVPTLLGYVKKAKLATANTNAKEIYMNTVEIQMLADVPDAWLSTGGQYQVIKQATVASSYTNLQTQLAAASTDEEKNYIQICMDHHSDTLDGWYGAVYEYYRPVTVVWASSDSSNAVVGRYPEPILKSDDYTWADFFTYADDFT